MRVSIIEGRVLKPVAVIQNPTGSRVKGSNIALPILATLSPPIAFIEFCIVLLSVEPDLNNNVSSGQELPAETQIAAGILNTSFIDFNTDEKSSPRLPRKPAIVLTDTVSTFKNTVLPGQRDDVTQIPRNRPLESDKFLTTTGKAISRSSSRSGNVLGGAALRFTRAVPDGHNAALRQIAITLFVGPLRYEEMSSSERLRPASTFGISSSPLIRMSCESGGHSFSGVVAVGDVVDIGTISDCCVTGPLVGGGTVCGSG